MRRTLFVLTLARALTGFAFAVEPEEMLADAALEGRAREVSREIRCVVCQSQNIDDSNAPLARDLRLLVRERLAAGDTNAEARAYIVARYGDYVLLKPRFDAQTFVLWLAPAALLLIAGCAAFAFLYNQRRNGALPLTAEEEKALAAMLEEKQC
jgi:cytochrome c-type biogenesis protein CcmH